MVQPGFSSVAPVDPYLTTLSIGFRNDSFYWDQIAPVVPTSDRAATFTKYEREFWFRVEDGENRGPAAPYTRIGWEATTESYACEEIGFEEILPDPIRAASRLGQDLTVTNVQHLTNAMQLALEKRVADELFNKDGVWSTDATITDWDTVSGDPLNDVDTGVETMLKYTGVRPNVLFLSLEAWNGLRKNAKVTSEWETSSGSKLLTPENFATLSGLDRVVVLDRVYTSGKEGQVDANSNYSYIYGKHALLLVQNSGITGVPNAASTFIWDERGNVPWALETYREENIRSTVIRAFTHIDIKVVSSLHGYRLKGVVS